jgi:hypothetical protein
MALSEGNITATSPKSLNLTARIFKRRKIEQMLTGVDLLSSRRDVQQISNSIASWNLGRCQQGTLMLRFPVSLNYIETAANRKRLHAKAAGQDV